MKETISEQKGRLDPPADDVVQQACRDDPTAFGTLARSLGRWSPGPGNLEPPADLPPGVKVFLEDHSQFGDFDAARERILRCQRRFRGTHASGAQIVLAAGSLPVLYVHRQISLTLAGSGQLLKNVPERVRDTRQFFNAVMTPESLEPGQPGRMWIRKVRLTHAVVREAFHRGRELKDPAHARTRDYHYRLLSVKLNSHGPTPPLDQVELAFVLQSFAHVVTDGMARMGWGMGVQDLDDYLFTWSVVGRLLGIDGSLVPGINLDPNGRSAFSRELFESIRDEEIAAGDPFREDDASWARAALAAALLTTLVQFQRAYMPERFRIIVSAFPFLDAPLQQLPRVLIRRLCGGQASRLMRLTRPPLLDWIICQIAMILVDLRAIDVPQVRDSPHDAAAPTRFGAWI